MRTTLDITAPTFLADLRDFLRRHLLEDIMPFWMRHAVDPAGGLNTCLGDDGTRVSRDKWLWSQWRAVWVFSRLYRTIDPRPEWLSIARQIRDFVARCGWDDDIGGWVLLLSGDGEVLRGCESIYADAFAIYALVELARAADDGEALALARKTGDHVLRRLEAPHDQVPHFPYPVPSGARMHGLPTMFSLKLWELGKLIGDRRYLHASEAMSDEVFQRFYRADRDLILERISADGSEYPPPEGTTVVPGHAIEDMWFQLLMALDRNQPRRADECCRLIRRHLEMAWDDEHGGIFLAVDADGRDEVAWEFADSKLWWPHTEAMVGLLLAYEYCGERWCLDWYRRVHEYAFVHYPMPDHGEWRQKLDRRGEPLQGTPALPVKDPFHLPRALILSVEVLQRLIAV